MRFGLVLHAETNWNVQRRLQGQSNSVLTEKGRADVQKVIPLIEEHCRDARLIVSSPLARAFETAQIIQNSLQLPVEKDIRLMECSFGTLEGMTRQGIIQLHGSESERHLLDNKRSYDFRAFQGEHRDAVLERHLALLRDLMKQYNEECILLVGHSRGFDTLLDGLGYPAELKRGEVRTIDIQTLD